VGRRCTERGTEGLRRDVIAKGMEHNILDGGEKVDFSDVREKGSQNGRKFDKGQGLGRSKENFGHELLCCRKKVPAVGRCLQSRPRIATRPTTKEHPKSRWSR